MNEGKRQAFIGMGANLGDRLATLSGAIQQLSSSKDLVTLASSSIYETDPVGNVVQPKFLNLVVGIETSLAPEALLDVAMEIELGFGRVRDVRWGPRTLDLDLLAYEKETRSTTRLHLPHPRMWDRAFVIVPLREVLALPPFQRSAWDALRTQAARPVSLHGVRPFTGPTGKG